VFNKSVVKTSSCDEWMDVRTHNDSIYTGWQWCYFVRYLCQLVSAAILWVKLLEMFVTLLSLKHVLSVVSWSRGHFLKLISLILFEWHGKSSPVCSIHYAKLYPQNGEHNLTINYVTSFHPVYRVNRCLGAKTNKTTIVQASVQNYFVSLHSCIYSV